MLRSLLCAATLTFVFTQRGVAITPGGGGQQQPAPQIGPGLMYDPTFYYYQPGLFPGNCGCLPAGTPFRVPREVDVLQALGLPEDWAQDLSARLYNERVDAQESTPAHPLDHVPSYLDCDGCVSTVIELSRTEISPGRYEYIYKYIPNIPGYKPVYVRATVNTGIAHLGMYVPNRRI